VSSSARRALVRTERHSTPGVHTRMRGAAGTNRSQTSFNVGPQAVFSDCHSSRLALGVELQLPPHVIGTMAPVAVEIIVVVFNRGHSSAARDLISTARLTPSWSSTSTWLMVRIAEFLRGKQRSWQSSTGVKLTALLVIISLNSSRAHPCDRLIRPCSGSRLQN
jgi:hypothetical protein